MNCECERVCIHTHSHTLSTSYFSLQIRWRILRYQCLMTVKVYVHDFTLWDVFLNYLFCICNDIYILQVHSLSLSSMCVVRDGEYKKRVAIKRGFVAHHNLMEQ